MIEKQCEMCGKPILAKSQHQKFCEKCAEKRQKIRSKKFYQKNGALCNPPFECPNCNYDDCIRDGRITKAEKEYLKAGELSRNGQNVLMIDDVIHHRNGRLV